MSPQLPGCLPSRWWLGVRTATARDGQHAVPAPTPIVPHEPRDRHRGTHKRQRRKHRPGSHLSHIPLPRFCGLEAPCVSRTYRGGNRRTGVAGHRRHVTYANFSDIGSAVTTGVSPLLMPDAARYNSANGRGSGHRTARASRSTHEPRRPIAHSEAPASLAAVQPADNDGADAAVRRRVRVAGS